MFLIPLSGYNLTLTYVHVSIGMLYPVALNPLSRAHVGVANIARLFISAFLSNSFKCIHVENTTPFELFGELQFIIALSMCFLSDDDELVENK